MKNFTLTINQPAGCSSVCILTKDIQAACELLKGDSFANTVYFDELPSRETVKSLHDTLEKGLEFTFSDTRITSLNAFSSACELYPDADMRKLEKMGF